MVRVEWILGHDSWRTASAQGLALPAKIYAPTAQEALSLLRLAVRNDHEATVKHLMDCLMDSRSVHYGRLLVDAMSLRWTLLMCAAWHNSYRAAAVLLHAKAQVDLHGPRETDVCVMGDSTCSPVLQAALQGHASMVRLLIEAKANVHEEDTRDNVTVLKAAAAGGDVECVRLVLECKANVNACDGTALTRAAQGGHVGAVRVLLEAGAWVDHPSADVTPLTAAVRGNAVVVVSVLLEAKANVRTEDGDGWTPLAVAALEGNEACVSVLVRAKADVNERDDDGKTPLFHASESYSAHAARRLVKFKADVNAVDRTQHMPLYYATRSESAATVALLLAAKALVDAVDRRTRTALYYAALNLGENAKEILHLLLDAKANVTSKVQDLCPRESWHAAVAKGNEAVAAMLFDAAVERNQWRAVRAIGQLIRDGRVAGN